MTLAVRTLYAHVFVLGTPEVRLLVDAGTLPCAAHFARIVRGLRPAALLITHAHVDQAGAAFVAARRGVRVLAFPSDAVVGAPDGAHLPRPAYNHVKVGRTLQAIAELDLGQIWPFHSGPLSPEQLRVRARRGPEMST